MGRRSNANSHDGSDVDDVSSDADDGEINIVFPGASVRFGITPGSTVLLREHDGWRHSTNTLEETPIDSRLSL